MIRTTGQQIDAMALRMINQLNTSFDPTKPPSERQLTQDERDLCRALDISESVYIGRYNQLERDNGRAISKIAVPEPATAIELEPLSESERAAARGFNMTDEQYQIAKRDVMKRGR